MFATVVVCSWLSCAAGEISSSIFDRPRQGACIINKHFARRLAAVKGASRCDSYRELAYLAAKCRFFLFFYSFLFFFLFFLFF